MIDETTAKGRLIAAALRLAADRRWRDVTLIDVADAAGVTLADVRAEFHDKAAVVRGFVRAIDDAVLRQPRRPQPGEGPRDALFEVIMARLDALAPYKPAVRSILAGADPDPAMVGTMLGSQQWMLQAAGIDAGGGRGLVRTLGLASLYGSVLRTWLDDDDPGMARTMAALDRRLRRGERNIQALEGACEAASGFCRRLEDLVGGGARRTRDAMGPRPDPDAAAPRPDPGGVA